ncbi:acylneuraminate cytidylyltransferase family protein [Marispirochaeta aestuarii]|uniref:acylneuraminate cytidylyltransferase family protein n=1 Tax=Marispirochaeta aestuarii TaxID=1963862 RepID=UPI002ABE2438|nr:acylneuraminate cytidylyltransferase family protein [Marispirochaeta aestuarii]
MINNQSILAIIPARGGSKSIPRKNIRKLKGRPLIEWTIIEALKSKYIDKLIVSTDDIEIAQIAEDAGADIPFMRPSKYAKDSSRGIDVLIHALTFFPNIDVVVQLQPTSPFRSVSDIDGAIMEWSKRKATIVTVTKVSKPPEWMYIMDNKNRLHPILGSFAVPTNRQQLSVSYSLNGAVYVASRDSIINNESFLLPSTVGYIMPPERSIDIDSYSDWQYAEYMMNKRSNEQ